MPRFAALPNEIQLAIVQYTASDDIESLTLASKNLSSLGSRCLQTHLAYKRKYTIYDCSRATKSLHALLEDVLKDSKVAPYVKELRINEWRSEWDDESLTSVLVHTPYSEETMTAFRDAASRLTPRNTWMNARIEGGDEDPILLLLMLSLPNLESLKFPELGQDCVYTKQALFQIATTTSTTPPLSRLTHIQLLDEETLDDTSLELFTTFARLPSVRTLRAWNVCGLDFGTPIPRLLPLHTSSVTDVHIHDSSLCPRRLLHLAKGFKALESFTWDDRYYYCGTLYDPTSIIMALRQHRHTLHSLTFLLHSSSPRHMGYLHGFPVLRTLEVELQCLIPATSHHDVNAVADALPSSIETLCLRLSAMRGYRHQVPGLIFALARLKQARFPQLKEVRLLMKGGVGDLSSAGRGYGRILERCRGAGIDLIVAPLIGMVDGVDVGRMAG